MRIIDRANGRETTLGSAVSITVDGDPDALRDMVTRLLEELCFNPEEAQVLRAGSLSRILAYDFEVTED